MKPSLSRLPSPALVIACVALFVSLGGVSYGLAKGSVDSREIKNNTIRSKDVRNNTLRTFDIRNNEVRGFDIRNSTIQGRDVAFNTLTGNDVAESSLGKVPSATTADTATSANTANSVATLKTIAPTSLAEGAAAVTLATHGPLTLTGACEAAASPRRRCCVCRPRRRTPPRAEPRRPSLRTHHADQPSLGDGDLRRRPISMRRPLGAAFGASTCLPSHRASRRSRAARHHADAAANTCLFHGHVALEG